MIRVLVLVGVRGRRPCGGFVDNSRSAVSVTLSTPLIVINSAKNKMEQTRLSKHADHTA